jgi:LmbE family N-acetylglucosaminyl deacetylase
LTRANVYGKLKAVQIISKRVKIMEISELLPLPNLEGCKSLLAVQPHPDDNEIGAGATIAKLAENGCRITYLTVTDGSIGTSDPSIKREEVAAIRRKEVERSAAYLGVSAALFLDFPDGGYVDEKFLCQSIVQVIRNVKPEIVLAPDPFLPYEAHPDHRSVGMAAAEACLFCQFPGFKTGDGAGPGAWAVKGIAFHSTAWPNTFIGVDATWEKKMKAIALHESQFSPEALQPLSMYFAFKAAQYAKDRPFKMAEAFKALTTDHLHMNVDTINL